MHVDTQYALRLFHTYALPQRPQREIPHLRKCPYKEGVGTAQNQMPSGGLWAPDVPQARIHENVCIIKNT